jgi:hypothetical protein
MWSNGLPFYERQLVLANIGRNLDLYTIRNRELMSVAISTYFDIKGIALTKPMKPKFKPRSVSSLQLKEKTSPTFNVLAPTAKSRPGTRLERIA